MAKKKWMKTRHKIITRLAYLILKPYSVFKYGIKIEKFKEQGNRSYLVLFNHQTAFDQFFVGMAFKGPIYYVASEDLFSQGFVSTLIKFLVAPIPIRKQTTDASAVMNCIRVAREGGTIAIAPEGNRTYDGKPVFMNPAIAPLAKKLKLPIALYRIEGGYGVHPRWSDVVRKGKMMGYVSKVIEPEEYKSMSNEELFSVIKDGLAVNEAGLGGKFFHKKNAECLERVFYVCHKCGLSEFESNGDVIKCKKCGEEIKHLPTKELESKNGGFPFNFVGEWYDFQCDFINNLNVNDYINAPIYTDKIALSKINVFKNRELLNADLTARLYGNKITVGELTFDFSVINAVTVLGKNKLNIYTDDALYQFKGDKRFNALKYMNIYYRYKNLNSEEIDEKFLGL
ncbi:MAG: 1-acyl-sn-glycerol-3-phosphate acyltransferase [Clostridia bacterium]|nr:1-acyl-sn-glycerol-3-phosphate acyltransferase [Clostridia bacterium]